MFRNSCFRAWSDEPPWLVGSCATCGCLVLLLPYSDGRVALFDPPFADRRWLRSILAPASVRCQGFASLTAFGIGHDCPPEADCQLPRAERRAAAYRHARRATRGGLN